jgi:hypothetical protein
MSWNERFLAHASTKMFLSCRSASGPLSVLTLSWRMTGRMPSPSKFASLADFTSKQNIMSAKMVGYLVLRAEDFERHHQAQQTAKTRAKRSLQSVQSQMPFLEAKTDESNVKDTEQQQHVGSDITIKETQCNGLNSPPYCHLRKRFCRRNSEKFSAKQRHST